MALSTASFWKLDISIFGLRSACSGSSFWSFRSSASKISLKRSQIALITVVFPVPGGPWISAISGVLIAMFKASICSGFKLDAFLKLRFNSSVTGLLLPQSLDSSYSEAPASIKATIDFIGDWCLIIRSLAVSRRFMIILSPATYKDRSPVSGIESNPSVVSKYVVIVFWDIRFIAPTATGLTWDPSSSLVLAVGDTPSSFPLKESSNSSSVSNSKVIPFKSDFKIKEE